MLKPKDSIISPNGESGKVPPALAKAKIKTELPPTIPAFKVFIEVTDFWGVTKYWRKQMGEVVGEKPEKLSFWRQVVEAYTGKGWFKGDVKTMLEEYFVKGVLPGQDRKNGAYQNNSPPPKTNLSTAAQEVVNRLQAEDAAQIFNPLA